MTTIADIIGAEGANGRPDQVRSVAAQFRQIHTVADQIHSGLGDLTASRWTGTAANTFREQQSTELPKQLDLLSQSFSTASDALQSYSGRLESVQQRAAALASQLNDAQAASDSAHGSERTANSAVRTKTVARLGATDPASAHAADTALTTAKQAATRASAARAAADARLSSLHHQADDLRNELFNAAVTCGNQLSAATNEGIKNNVFSWADRHVVNGAVGHVTGDVVHGAAGLMHWLEHAAHEAFDVIKSIGSDHFLAAWSTFAHRLEVVLAVVGVVLAVVIAIVALVASGGTALPALIFVGEILGYVGLGLSVTNLAADGLLFSHGKKSRDDVVEDGIDVALTIGTLGLSKYIGGKAGIDGVLKAAEPDTASPVYRIAATEHALIDVSLEKAHDNLAKALAPPIEWVAQPIFSWSGHSLPPLVHGGSSFVRHHVPQAIRRGVELTSPAARLFSVPVEKGLLAA